MKRLAVGLLALLAACGSTVPPAARRGAGPGSNEFGPADGVAQSVDQSTVSTAVGSVAAARAGAGATSGASRIGAVANGGTVSVGVRYPVNSNGLLTGAGFSSAIRPGDSKAIAEAVVDDINGRGGIAGRKIVPVWVPFDVTASIAPGGSDSEQQKACAGFTEDNKVFAAVSPIVSGEVLQVCLAKHGVVFVDENWNYFSTDISADNYWDPAYPDPLRSVPALVDRLVATGFIDRKAKIGVVYQDLPNRRPVLDKALRPALSRHGLKIDAEVAWTAQRAEVLAAGVLQFRSMGVTHVFDLDPGGLETFGWMAQAESQGYRPKYALDTRNYPFLQASQSPARQLENARGIGWVPAADIGVPQAKDLSATERRCLAVVARAGQDMTDATNVRIAFAYCDTLWFLREAASGAAAAPTLSSVKVGGEGLLDGYAPVGTFRTHFGRHRHDGASAARDLSFDTSCTCFRYSGPVFSIG